MFIKAELKISNRIFDMDIYTFLDLKYEYLSRGMKLNHTGNHEKTKSKKNIFLKGKTFQ